PSNQNIALSHGDFRIGNIMYENSSLMGVLDWEFASWSDPLEDIGWLCARCWRYGNDNMQVGGIGDLSDFISGYIEVAKTIPDWSALSYWKIFGTVKWALIAHQQGLRRSKNQKKQLELFLTAQKAYELEHDILTQIKNFNGN
ncbi:MAG: phosphotransferase, partial [Alphaproteobacteria bacterium]|nr:phosphotransferase [Alphaproteobacteria bacterium]